MNERMHRRAVEGGRWSRVPRTTATILLASTLLVSCSDDDSPSTGGSGASAPIRIGVVGTMSGIGAVQSGTPAAVRAWAAAVNAGGGLNGHPVEVVVADDQGDAARFRAELQNLVENRKVVAFVGNLTVFSISQAAVRYLEEKRVPMVGGDRLSRLWNESPMMFPQASAGPAAVWIHALALSKVAPPGARVGLLTCQETAQCRDGEEHLRRYIPALGLTLMYTGKVSLAQPDFTSECLEAQSAGVEYFIVATDPNSVRRTARSCDQQRFDPTYVIVQTASSMAQEPALLGTHFASATFPWVSDDTPATREFQDAMRKYQPDIELSGHASSGWVAAKLFEKAAAGIGPDDEPSAARVLDGLWALRDDTLGGITAPLTFVRDRPAPHRYCYFPMQLREGGWAALSNQSTCQAPPP